MKRVYDPPSPADGQRVLVDRVWPRGLSRERVDALWLQDLAPSADLRRWFGHDPARFPEFEARYREELLLGDGLSLLRLARMAATGDVTLVYGARDTRHNQAQVLARVVEEFLAPPPKAELRHRFQAWRDGLAGDEVRRRSQAVRAAVVATEAYHDAGGVLLYLSVGHEVETLTLMRGALSAGKRVFAPRVDRASRRLQIGEVRDPETDLVPGPFQAIPEPRVAQPAPEVAALVDLVLVPGLAFDRFGNRVGYGAGYYDRLLPELGPRVPRVALLFAGQLVPRCPPGPSDQTVSALACEEGLLPLWSPLD
ncbi:5-formyltetrahydrofolate cyclo-ligase [Limnochorda pilosa]|uniref:Uroporphyrin-III C-methyltransferase n=1 Tax=Limnochorda pilosa TaxID=1555112 RepID=A0A0K2SFY0_LIMPI|nr:5-formyltetrahydrofolate cyclo-ligase [Limnochorda pilosa]BAS26011.1 uroporphyrin-III C-methyltransferase [Limnochorda pilosa]